MDNAVRLPKELALKVAREIIQREHENNWETVNIGTPRKTDILNLDPAKEAYVYFSRYEKVVIK